MNVSIDKRLSERLPDFSLGVIHYAGVSLSESPKMLQGRMNLYTESLRLEHELERISEIAGVEGWCTAFKQLRIDPSRYRPSSEALLRRVLQNKPLTWVHTGVDVNNFLSIRYALPFGLYDHSSLQGSLICRLGQVDDTYEGLNRREMDMNGKLLLADDSGAFGSPIVDSIRTRVGEHAKELVQVIFFHPNISPNEREEIIGSTAKMMTEINGGEAVFSTLVTAS